MRLKIVLLLFLSSFSGFAQQGADDQAFRVLDKALEGIWEKENYAIYFKAIAFDVRQPLDIFSLPAYRQRLGGYIYVDGKRFEMRLGVMKALCDGKLLVMVDESSGLMVVDSLREKTMEGFDEELDLEALLNEKFGLGQLSLEGKELVNKRECYRIRCTFENSGNEALYYVDVQKGTLTLMAERTGEDYDVYLVDRIGAAPPRHVYTVNLPDRELEELYGYEVIDMRYTYRDLKY